MRVRSIAIWLAFAIGPAGAADIAVLGIHHPEATPSEQSAWMAALAHGVRASRHTPQRIDDPVFAPIFTRHADAILADGLLAEAQVLQDSARALIARAEPAAADHLLTLALAQAQEAAKTVLNTDTLVRLYAWHALANLRTGNRAAARESMGEAIALRAKSLPFDAWPADLLAFEALVREQDRLEGVPVTFAVDTASSAGVFLDGLARDVAPFTVQSVATGTHYAIARTTDGKVASASFEVLGDRALTVTLTPYDPVLRPVGDPALTAHALIESLGSALGCDKALVAAEQHGVWLVQALDVETGLSTTPQPLPSDPTDSEGIDNAVKAALTDTHTADLIALDLASNTPLARALLLPAPPAPTAALALDTTAKPHGAPQAHALKWPAWLGIGLGVAAGAAIGTTLGVLLPKHEGAPGQPAGPSQGSIVIVAPGTP